MELGHKRCWPVAVEQGQLAAAAPDWSQAPKLGLEQQVAVAEELGHRIAEHVVVVVVGQAHH